MTIRIEAYLDDYDLENSTDGQPGFQYQGIFVDCTDCPNRLPVQVPTLEAARAWVVDHAAGHQAGEARCQGCGCWVEIEHLDAKGFGPDCQIQDEGSQCG